ncbi:MAG TPA: hypothetical protein DCG12_05050 [Planctomycetaceae bacterium]|nr:hypothetical protein [Planctomycetaceae bacterium]
MNKILRNPFVFLTLGAILGAGAMNLRPQPELKANSAHGNDKFSMCTVQTSIRGTDAVFVLDHLTGTLRGGWVATNGQFTNAYQRNVTQDFQLNPATPDPKFAIVSGYAALGGTANAANGIVYVGELTSGSVVAYGFAQPNARNAGVPLELVRLGAFTFRDALGN